jgi:hypothetical protein
MPLLRSSIFFSTLFSNESRASSVGIATGYGLDCRWGLGTFRHSVQTGSGAHPTSYPMGTGAISLGIKRPGREADHSPPSSAEVKEWVDLYLHSPNTSSWRGAELSTGTTLLLSSSYLTLLSNILSVLHTHSRTLLPAWLREGRRWNFNGHIQIKMIWLSHFRSRITTNVAERSQAEQIDNLDRSFYLDLISINPTPETTASERNYWNCYIRLLNNAGTVNNLK